MARIGIIGTGWGTRSQVPNFREAGLEVVAIAGAHRNKTRRMAEEIGGLEPYDDWHDLIRAANIDLVSITVPPSEHLQMATAALSAGKHVLSEKPTTLNAAEAEKLVAAAKAHADRIAIIDHELRFLPAWRAARERIGELGAIWYVEVRYASPNWGDPERQWKWWNDAKRGGGVWGAVGSHFVDATRYFAGEIESVQAVMQTFVKPRTFGEGTMEVTSDDFASVQLRLRSGALAAMTFSAVSGAPDEPSSMTIHGEHGALRLVGAEALLARRGGPYEQIGGGPMEERPGNSMGGAFGSGTVELGRALVRALDSGDRAALAPAATFEDGLAQQSVLDAARRAAREGGWVGVG